MDDAPKLWYLREWREHLGLTVQQVAELMGTNKGQVSKLELGEFHPNGQRMNDRWIKGFSTAFHISPWRLMLPPAHPTVDDLMTGASPEQVAAVRLTVAMMLNKPLPP